MRKGETFNWSPVFLAFLACAGAVDFALAELADNDHMNVIVFPAV